MVVKNRIQRVEAFKQVGEQATERGQAGIAGEVARGFELKDKNKEGVGGLFRRAGGDGGVVFLPDGEEALLHLVHEVEEAVRGVGLLKEKLGDVAGLAPGLVKAAVGVLRAQHAEEGGKLGVVAIVAGEVAAPLR